MARRRASDRNNRRRIVHALMFLVGAGIFLVYAFVFYSLIANRIPGVQLNVWLVSQVFIGAVFGAVLCLPFLSDLRAGRNDRKG